MITLTQDITAGPNDGELVVDAGVTVTLNLNGHTLSRGLESAAENGGVIRNNGTLNVSGAPVVSGNSGPDGDNIYLRNAHRTMTVTGALTDGASLYVSSARGTDTITSGYGTYNGSAYPGGFFHADDAAYGIAFSDGEACITATKRTVTIAAAQSGSVTADVTETYAGAPVTLTVTPDEGYWLSALTLYSADNDTPICAVDPGLAAFAMPDQDTVVKAAFKAQKAVSAEILYPFDGSVLYHVHGTLTADKQYAGGGETVTLTLTADEGYGLKTGGMTAFAYLDG